VRSAEIPQGCVNLQLGLACYRWARLYSLDVCRPQEGMFDPGVQAAYPPRAMRLGRWSVADPVVVFDAVIKA